MNYFIHGIQTVILAQGVPFFAARWGVDVATVFAVIAAIGIGKVSCMIFSGVLSDLFGRKPFIVCGITGYIIFFAGLLFCTDVRLAYVLAIIGGGATSFLDGGTYPALIEIYPERASVATLVLKGFIAIATTIVPLISAILTYSAYSYNWLILFALVLSLLSLGLMLRCQFPPQDVARVQSVSATLTSNENSPRFIVEGLLCLLFGFLCLGTFYLWQQSIGTFALNVVALDIFAARGVSAVFSVSTISSVVLTSMLLHRGIKEVSILVCYTCLSTIGIGLSLVFPSAATLYVTSIVLGFCMAGGLLQIGSTLLSSFFPQHKGRNTSLYNVSFALATYIVPLMTKMLLEHNMLDRLMFVLCCFSGASFIVACLLFLCYHRSLSAKVSLVQRKPSD
jgi:MFS family permease